MGSSYVSTGKKLTYALLDSLTSATRVEKDNVSIIF